MAPHCARMAPSSMQRRASTAHAVRASGDGRWALGVDACASPVQSPAMAPISGRPLCAAQLVPVDLESTRGIALGQHSCSLTVCRQAPGKPRGHGHLLVISGSPFRRQSDGLLLGARQWRLPLPLYGPPTSTEKRGAPLKYEEPRKASIWSVAARSGSLQSVRDGRDVASGRPRQATSRSSPDRWCTTVVRRGGSVRR
jgi:hypothetical protein